ncbi:CAP domain-containing protein [Gracilibacillus kekensis]|uniref:Uncharacterized protein, YkwD family n=1 Tax=Gracilibacillus kekensis TaxID=1027249 RepID=A0A1M7QHN9_9BACI|nr:CAP domain-containing protein [Gracilibacillus kekensis]SHN30563.1 uncharacterized protein, YkwD family [Gracilibacillus kekensis]
MIKKIFISSLFMGILLVGTGFSSDSTLSANHHVSNQLIQTIKIEKFTESNIQSLIDKFIADVSKKEETTREKNSEKEATQEEETSEKKPKEEKKQEVTQPEPKQKQDTPEQEISEERPASQESENEGNIEPETEATPTTEVTKKETSEEPQQTTEVSQFERQVVDLTNQERQKQGLPALKLDKKLSQVARQKSKDMATNGYFSHNSPTHGSPFDMMQQAGINYRTAGENIAKGQRTPEEVVYGWMNSEGHRANILNGDFTHIGVGYVENGNHWTQQFIGK